MRDELIITFQFTAAVTTGSLGTATLSTFTALTAFLPSSAPACKASSTIAASSRATLTATFSPAPSDTEWS